MERERHIQTHGERLRETAQVQQGGQDANLNARYNWKMSATTCYLSGHRPRRTIKLPALSPPRVSEKTPPPPPPPNRRLDSRSTSFEDKCKKATSSSAGHSTHRKLCSRNTLLEENR